MVVDVDVIALGIASAFIFILFFHLVVALDNLPDSSVNGIVDSISIFIKLSFKFCYFLGGELSVEDEVDFIKLLQIDCILVDIVDQIVIDFFQPVLAFLDIRQFHNGILMFLPEGLQFIFELAVLLF